MSEKTKQNNETIHASSIIEAVIEAIPAPVFYKDAQGRYLGFNDAFENFVGRTKEEMIGKDVFELWDKELAQVYYDADQALFTAGGKQFYEARVTYADGSIHDVMFHKAVFDVDQDNFHGMVGVMLDITERKNLERELHQSQELFSQAFHSNPGLIALTDPVSGEFIDVNASWLETLKYTRAQVIGKTAFDLDVWADLSDRERILEILSQKDRVRDFETELKAKDATLISCIISIEKIVSGNRDLVLWTANDISERKKAEVELRRMARTDPLTKLANRRSLFEFMKAAFKRAERHKTITAVLVLDLDGFKAVNDNHGHFIGDELLIEISRRMTKTVRETDLVARLGGDEFSIILEDVSTKQDIITAAQHIIDAVSRPHKFDNCVCQVGVSIGISIFKQDGNDVEELLSKADKALYSMKDAGKGGYKFYTA